ncbi:glycerate kinase [Conexibacter sp. S30A1]|jgi:glycerate kinase|uniref:glycerate kinase n=1 Tax=Conexibacter sp. S30A1 TaxID=2937800 RepID=UPI003530D927
MPRVLLAPDKFKGTLTAGEVAAGLAAGIRSRCPSADVVTLPIADGGDGLLVAFEAAGFERVAVRATDATGRLAPASYVRSGQEAIVEMAEVAGFGRARSPHDPMTASSRGVGEAIAAAIEAGCTRVLVGIGGSASTDGGVGLVQALGARVLDANGAEVGPGGLGAGKAATVELEGLFKRLGATRIEVACDVDNPLTGPEGAAVVYGPQKGADPDQVSQLDAALTRWADVVTAATGIDYRNEPGTGAAGGVGFAALAILQAQLRPGAELMLERLGFREAVAEADLVVTGEGSLDEQTLRGKAPAAVASASHAAGVPVVAVAGRCSLDEGRLRSAGFDDVYTLVDEASTPQQALDDPTSLLRQIGFRLAGRVVCGAAAHQARSR